MLGGSLSGRREHETQTTIRVRNSPPDTNNTLQLKYLAMAADLLDLQNAPDPQEIVQRAAAAIAAGQLVAFPTETVYGIAAGARQADAVSRLSEVKGRADNHPFTLAIKNPLEVMDYVPELSVVATRLARRCWPGPLTLVLPGTHPDSLLREFPENVQQAVMPAGTVGLRVPSHPAILAALELADEPFVLTSANLSGQPAAVTADEIVDTLGDRLDLILDDGPTRFNQASSVVAVQDNQIQLLREGLLDPDALKRLSSLVVLIVCTGNTCRSPMGELLLQQQIAQSQNCNPDQLEDRGILVLSAGLAAGAGFPASSESVDAVTRYNIDLANHESQPVTDRLVKVADLILTMTRSHRQAIVNHWPEAADRTHLLSRDNTDISDPIGRSADVYQQCAEQLNEQLANWLPDLDFSASPEAS